MVESVFQTLLLLAYFDIALVSITIANYAVSASYLGRESRLSRWRMERRKQKLLVKLKELQEETTEIQSIKDEIRKAEAEQRSLGVRIFLLSWLGAVILPSMFFVISFICSVFGMNTEILLQDLETQRFLEQQLILFSSGTLATGFMILLFVIRTIDSAARKLPIPEFEVYSENLMKAIKCKRNEATNITLCIANNGEDVAENLQIFMMFPSSVKVHASHKYSVVRQSSETEHPDYNAAIFVVELLHIDVVFAESVAITPPDEKKTYEIPISIYERKMGVSKHKLAIEVTD